MGYSPRIEDFFELDSSKGVLRSRFDKARVFIISAVSFRIIQDGLYEAFSSGASTILHQMGMSYGQALAHRRIPGESRIRVLADLQILASVAGWGNISLIGDPTSDKKI